MMVLIDIGNSRLKWRRMQGRDLLPGGEFYHADGLNNHMLDECWSDLERPEAIWCVTVAAPALSQQLAEWCRAHWQRAVHIVEPAVNACGLRNGYLNPATLGADRWVAMVGAQQLYPGPACVADCGTALTIDCIDGQGQHLGGLILPGLLLMPRCVVEHTSRVSFTAAQGGEWLGRDTDSCLAAGALSAVVATLEHVADRFEQTYAVKSSRVITGGDAARIAPQLEAGWHHEPELIFIGLARLANEARG